MTFQYWAMFVGLVMVAIGLGLWALAIATAPGSSSRQLRHHAHLLPLTPRRFRPARG